MKTDIFKISELVSKKEKYNKEKVDSSPADEAADFETALLATGFGKFNFILLTIIAFPGAVAPGFETTTMSFVFPAAQCDLDLSLQNKGTLNAITYLGMITSGLFWGFFADTLGRRKLLILGYYLDALIVLCSGLSQSFEILLTFKYFGGFIINGPFAVLTSYLAEFHSTKYRAKVQLLIGLVLGATSIILPVLAWGMFQIPVNLNFLNINIHNWNVFLFLCALPSFISGTTILFMPESPKFLMSMGANDKAIQVFRKVYAMNTGKSPDSYPIKNLVNEIESHKGNENKVQITANRTKTQAIKEGWQQVSCIFNASYRVKVVLVCLIQMSLTSGVNTIRLWLPQIFVAIVNYQNKHDGASSSLCEMLSMVQANVTFVEGEKICEVDVSSLSPYVNSIIVSAGGILGCLATAVIINKVRKKLLLVALSLISLASSLSLYFSQGTTSILVLTTVFQSTASVAANILVNIAIEIFPTTIRTIALSLVMVLARIGALTGSMLLPILLEAGCLPPFVLEGVLFAVATILSLLLPRTDKKALE